MSNDLVISVGGSIRDLERQLKSAADVAAQRADEIENEFKRRNPSFAGDFGLGVLKGAIAALSFEKIVSGIAAATREIASFADTARRAGIEVERLQSLRLAAGAKGVEGKTFDAGVEGLAKALNDTKNGENELSKLLDANGIKYKDRKGDIISTNEALAVAADLISRAASEQDKIAIAEKLGIPRDFVPLLEGGADALNRLAEEASKAGVILDADVVRRAKEFDDAWSAAWSSFVTNTKASVAEAATGLAGLIKQAIELQQRVETARGAGSALGKTIATLAAGGEPTTAPLPPARPDGTPTNAPLPPARPGRGHIGSDVTRIPASKSGGGGGGGKSEEEQAQDRLDRYIETLMRQNSVLDAQIATFGRSNAEKRAAVELAKAQVDLGKLDEDSRAKVIASLTKEIQLSEQKRTQLESLKQTQKGLVDAQKFFGEAVTDGLTDMIVNGAKAQDVLKNLTATLIKATLQAALLGNGPLAGIFGTAGTNGNLGGIFGLLGGLKFASGGFVSGPGSNRSDSVPARLSNGEFVVNAGATRKHRDLLEAINNGRVPMMAAGGLVGSLPAIAPRAGSGGGLIVNVQNNTPAQVETKPRSDGGVDMIIRQVEGAMAQRFVRGQGSLSQAFGAVQNGRQYRG
jgi:hypothetical protein